MLLIPGTGFQEGSNLRSNVLDVNCGETAPLVVHQEMNSTTCAYHQRNQNDEIVVGPFRSLLLLVLS